MSKLSFSDKLKVLIEVSKNTNLLFIAIIFLIFISIIFYTTNKKNQKRTKIIYLGSSVFILVFFFLSYNSSLSNMFDYMMNNFFIAIYFPNLAIYLFALIITNIILWISLFNYRTSKIIKNINITVYLIMNYLLYLILNIINENNLDIFTQSSVYNNEKATALIELSSILFIVWILFLIIYKLYIVYLKKEYKPKVKRLIRIKKVKKLPENYTPKETPHYIYGISPQKTIQKSDTNDSLLQTYDKMLTLEDYKLVLSILKDQKEKEQMKRAREVEQIKEENKFSELESLYKN